MYTTETDRMLAEGGVMQEGNTVDPVSGNDVPPGALKEEVRDDIDAKLSEGEFVIPADVVRYIGLSTLMKMRDKAKEGLKKMEEIGQMGNAEEVANAEALHGGDKSEEMDDESFSAEVDSIMNEDMGTEEQAFAEGGYVDPANEPLYKSAPIKGFEMVTMTNESGNTIYIPHVNGKPLLAVPAGYTAKKGVLPTIEDPAAAAAARNTVESGGGGEGSSGTTSPSQGGAVPSFDAEGRAVAATTGLTNNQAGILGTVVGLVTGIPMLGLVARFGNDFANKGYAKDAADVNRGIADTMGVNFADYGPTATTGVGGTGGQAASAAASAAAAATAAGYSEAAIGAASQAAASAVVGGASATAAAEAGREAASKAEAAERGAIGQGEVDAINAATGQFGATTSPVSAPDITTTDLGPAPDTTTTDNGGSRGMGGTPAGGETSSQSGVGNPGESAGDSGYSGGTTGAGDGGGGIGAGEGLAKGGFVTKKNKPAVKTKRGLASRK